MKTIPLKSEPAAGKVKLEIDGTEGARRATGVPSISKTLSPLPDPEVPEKKPRRRFTTAYKLRILKEHDACTIHGEIGALLRREGLYYSNISTWLRQRDEQTVHEVCLSEFSISKYEITQEQWQVVMASNPAENQENPNYPIDVVSWYDAERFIKKLNEMTVGRYRLPTEAEWEFACRSGGEKVKYGTADDTSDRQYVINSDTEEDERSIRPVGSFPPNELGLYDMSGNVSEWVQDWYELEYYKRSPVNDPQV